MENKNKTIDELRKEGLKILRENETPALDRDLILSFVTGFNRSYLIAHGEEEVSEDKIKKYNELLDERKKGKPIAYILGIKEFMGRDFTVNEHVLIPRPDTEVLIEETLKKVEEIYPNKEVFKVLDMCSGSGAIGITLALENKKFKVTLSDISKEAMKVAVENARKFNIEKSLNFNIGNLFKNLEGEKFHVIVSNPPYIRKKEVEELMGDVKDFEPHLALDGGEDGLDFYREITKESTSYLVSGGLLVFEIGHDQKEDVEKIMKVYGFKEIKTHKDISGIRRVIEGRI